jgi:hypothetical protein
VRSQTGKLNAFVALKRPLDPLLLATIDMMALGNYLGGHSSRWGVTPPVNGRFYEGVCQAPLNSDVQWFTGLSPLDTVVVIHDSVAGACLSLTQGASEIQGRGV